MNWRDPRPHTTSGEFIGVATAIGVGALILFATLWVLSSYAHAHDTGKGWSYPWECCADHDCTQIDSGRVRADATGYVVDGKFHVAYANARNSPDGNYHACFPKPDVLKCFWAPPPAG